MATVGVDDEGVTVRLAPWERVLGLAPGRLTVPWAAVRHLERVEHPTRVSATGVGRVGLAVPGVLKVGRWGIGSGTRRLVSVRRRVPALRVVVDQGFRDRVGYDELLVSTAQVDRLLAAAPVRT